MNYYNFNGKLFPEQEPALGPNSRAVRYGDGLFETIKYRNGQLLLQEEHFDRLWQGMRLLKFDIPAQFTPQLLKNEIERTVQKNKHTSARIRMAIVRGEGGMFDPKNHLPNYIIQSWQLPQKIELLNSNGLVLSIYRDGWKSCDSFCNVKHNNYLCYCMAALYAKEQFSNDALLLNNYGRICDSSIANVYMIKDEKIFTPSLSEGCIAGVMRNFLIQHLPVLGYPVEETQITEQMLYSADEVFLSNSIFNIRWIAHVGSYDYKNKKVVEMVNALHNACPGVFY
ncbi:MAG: hypothetical protein ABS68_14105 [Niastella sp. SCN 39-18]|nr:aminotransferase class IV [Sphingobacteriales bacterium]ODT49355.1 MAG: hypothetical protein ABS68_14105 [Niastella sp. SCN 39-18]